MKQTFDMPEQLQLPLRLFASFVLLAVYLKWRNFPCFLLAGRGNVSLHLLGLMRPMSVSEWASKIMDRGKECYWDKI